MAWRACKEQVEANPAISNEAETSVATRAVMHADRWPFMAGRLVRGTSGDIRARSARKR